MEEIESYIVLIVSSILIRYSLIYSHQPWAKSYSQTITFLLLPIITYTITVTIAGNIALSLGMIGALSIVRFRHPVKNPLELVMYFNLITLGIAASVRTKWAINLTIITILIIFMVRYAHFFYKKYFKKNLFNTSFSEGVEYSTLEIYSQSKNDVIENSQNLKKIIYDKEDGYIYFMSFEKEKDLVSFKSDIENNSEIKRIETNVV
tara:strand:+ start:72 stop:689 length:618 start_codon:yes stop_codon:yes gene_type:complete